MKTARQAAEKSGQTVHVYYNEQTKQYEAFRLYRDYSAGACTHLMPVFSSTTIYYLDIYI